MEDSLSCDGQVDAEVSEVEPQRRLRLTHRAAAAASKLGAATGGRGAAAPRSRRRAAATVSKVELVRASLTRRKLFQELGMDFYFHHFIQEGKPFHRKRKIHSSIPTNTI